MLSHRHLRFLLLLTLGVVVLSPDFAFAQRPGRRGGKRPRARARTSTAQNDKSKGTTPGAEPSTYKSFEPVTSDKDETLLGVLTVRPLDGGLLKLNVRRDEQLKIQVGDRSIDIDPLPDFLSRGLFCTATWEWDKKPGDDSNSVHRDRPPRRTDPKRLQSLRLDTLEVEGEIEEISGDMITLKVKPLNGEQWPDVAARIARNPDRYRDKTIRIVPKTLRLRITDGISAFMDAAGQELSLGDFEVEQKIRANIVFAGTSKKRTGILVDLRSLTAEEREGAEAGPRRPGDTGDGPKPRSRRPRRRGRRG